MLALSSVSASYGSVPAVDDVTIEVGEGEAVGLLGANGAGKSTTLRAISGLVRNVTERGTPTSRRRSLSSIHSSGKKIRWSSSAVPAGVTPTR